MLCFIIISNESKGHINNKGMRYTVNLAVINEVLKRLKSAATPAGQYLNVGVWIKIGATGDVQPVG